jgi:hypothetical protein
MQRARSLRAQTTCEPLPKTIATFSDESERSLGSGPGGIHRERMLRRPGRIIRAAAAQLFSGRDPAPIQNRA